MRRPSRTDPQRAKVLLPLLPSGSDGVHRVSPCGARPGRHLGSTGVETGIGRGRLALGPLNKSFEGECISERDYVGHPCPPPFRPPLCGVQICCPANSSNPDEDSQILFILEFFKWIADAIRLKNWRRERDSNPRYHYSTHAFQACSLSHSDISPHPFSGAADSTVPLICPQE